MAAWSRHDRIGQNDGKRESDQMINLCHPATRSPKQTAFLRWMGRNPGQAHLEQATKPPAATVGDPKSVAPHPTGLHLSPTPRMHLQGGAEQPIGAKPEEMPSEGGQRIGRQLNRPRWLTR